MNPSSSSALVSLLNPAMSARQKNSVAIIEREFVAAGFPLALAAAAAVNAYAESSLVPTAANGPMVGLFQLDRNVGAGRGMSDAQLVDPASNTRAIIREVQGSRGKALREAIAAGERHPHRLAYIFCRDIERPKNAETKAMHREGLTWTVFPGLAVPGAGGGELIAGEIGGAIASTMRHMSPDQMAMASLIEDRLAVAGLAAPIIVAAIVNAWAESGLNPAAVADEPNGTRSVGLFQLNDHGAGTGLTIAERKDPQTNIDRMLAVYRQGAGNLLERAYAAGERDVGVFTSLWTEQLERPKNASAVGVARRAMAYRLFPDWISFRAITDHIGRGGDGIGFGGFLFASGVIGTGLYLWTRSHRRAA